MPRDIIIMAMSVQDMLGSLGVARKSKARLKELFTPWGEALDTGSVLPRHPCPILKRDSWLSLNGLWDYAVTGADERPERFDGQILVPFSPEAPLSGVRRTLMPGEYLWYERKVSLPCHEGRWILHFEKVDQMAVVYINGKEAIRHSGGYLPFSVDITGFLGGRDNVITVSVQDPSDTSFHSRGKQKLNPGGIYYTAQSGIWQTVWLEAVAEDYIENLTFSASLSSVSVELSKRGGQQRAVLTVHQPTKDFESTDEDYASPVLLRETIEDSVAFSVPDPKLWSPSEPWLYPVEVTYGKDSVRSYFAIREIRAESGALLLNGNPIFLHGVLDQGYWPDGLCTAPSDEALVYDIAQMKKLGFNMFRKHAKIESRRWYYHCDRLGMLVWQDMVNGGSSYPTLLLTYMPTAFCVPGPRKKPGKSARTYPSFLYRITGRASKEGREEFRKEAEETVRVLRGHPSIICWGLFNEGWGQFDTVKLTAMLKSLDPSRLVDSASGWFDCLTGDFKSVHNYFRKQRVVKDQRLNIISEYGGIVCLVSGHAASQDAYGYHETGNREEFGEAFLKLLREEVLPLRKQGLAGAVYTQLSDIEEELNGLVTYDRRVVKLPESVIDKIVEAINKPISE